MMEIPRPRTLRPKGAQHRYKGQWYKIGRHGLVLVLRQDERWYNCSVWTKETLLEAIESARAKDTKAEKKLLLMKEKACG